jgi:hypothetical protein
VFEERDGSGVERSDRQKESTQKYRRVLADELARVKGQATGDQRYGQVASDMERGDGKICLSALQYSTGPRLGF